MLGSLIFDDGSIYEGLSFGKNVNSSGEVVFTTGMVGYVEALTDPSYAGQILVFTYPIIGNYGVGDRSLFESDKIHARGVIVCNYTETPSHFLSKMSLGKWLDVEGVPGLEIRDTRQIAQLLRDKGSMLGKIEIEKNNSSIDFYNPNLKNIVSKVSTPKLIRHGIGKKRIVLIDCGVKKNIIRSLLKRNIEIIQVPWDYDIFKENLSFDGILISNGPGDPKKAVNTIKTITSALNKKVPIFGICLGNQILTLAAGGDTYKLKYGHRSQNQPCVISGTKRCYITTQNHGFAVGKIPDGFAEWFVNVNDKTNEGIIHKKLPFMSVQFHPESFPGPQDTEWIFDEFIKRL